MTGAKLIVSSRYLKSGTKKNTVKRRNYTRYIATRETVELREQQKISVDGEVTDRQCELLAELLSDFPEAKSYLEYQDYTANPTGQNASELIGTIMERNGGRSKWMLPIPERCPEQKAPGSLVQPLCATFRKMVGKVSPEKVRGIVGRF